MHPYLQNIAIIAYVCAMGLALAHLVQRQAYVHRLAVLATLVGWIVHTLALVVLAIEIGGPPLGTLPNAVSVVVWVVVLLEMLVERQSGVTVLGAFVMPVVVVLSLKSSVARPVTLAPALGNAWIWIHIALALVGIAAFVLNFAGAIMYLLQERQIRHKRPGRFYHRLPPLETLDRWTYRNRPRFHRRSCRLSCRDRHGPARTTGRLSGAHSADHQHATGHVTRHLLRRRPHERAPDARVPFVAHHDQVVAAFFRHTHDGLRRMAGFDPRGQRQPTLGRDTRRVGLNLSIVGITLLLHILKRIDAAGIGGQTLLDREATELGPLLVGQHHRRVERLLGRGRTIVTD